MPTEPEDLLGLAGKTVAEGLVTAAEPVPDDEARQAVNAIGGYAYQLYQTVSAWIELEANELLFVEVAEDFAVSTQERLEGVQVRRTAGSITLRTKYVVDTINNFWILREKNSRQKVTFRYLTTSTIGRERELSFPNDLCGLEYWRVAARAGSDIQPLREALAALPLNSPLLDFLRDASDEEIRTELLRPIHWDCGEPPLDRLRERIVRDLVWRAERVAQANVIELKALVDPLLARVLHVATKNEGRELSSVELDRLIQERTQTQVPTEALRQLLAGQSQAAAISTAEFPREANARPLPAPLAERTSIIADLAAQLAAEGVAVLHGGSGLGKSTLARLLARSLGGDWQIVDFRGLSPDESLERLGSALRFVAEASAGIILDDLPVANELQIEPALALVVAAAWSKDQLVVITCSHAPPNRLLHFAPAAVVFQTPGLSVPEVRELISALGGDPDQWAELTHVACNGNPQLVHARLKRLAREGWPATEMLGGIDPRSPASGIEDERTAARRRLMQELDANARDLIYRLSLIGTHFDRTLALSLAQASPAIERPGEALDQLIGPWIEPLGAEYMRVSPLLVGASSEQFSEAQTRELRVCLVEDLVSRRPLTGALLSTTLLHAIACQHERALAILALLMMTTTGSNHRFVSEQLLALQFLNHDQPILPKDPNVSVLLRQAQFQVCLVHERWDAAMATVDTLFEEIASLPHEELREGCEIVATALVLSNPRLPASPSNWLARILRYRELRQSMSGEVGEQVRASGAAFVEKTGSDELQFLFNISASRIASVAELESLFRELDALPEDTRDDLLSAFDSESGDLRLFVSRPWFAEHKAETLEGETAAKIFSELAHFAGNWGHIRLAHECVVSQSVMLDEYASDAEGALGVLVDAEANLGPSTLLLRQRAKVLQNKGDHAGSLEVMRTIADHFDPDDHIERTLAFRSAAISAAELGNWSEAIDFFRKAQEAAQSGQEDILTIAVGFLGDIAGAQVHEGNVEGALQTMAQALEAVAQFNPPKSPLEHCIRAAICHVPSWMNEELFAPGGSRRYSLPPGICSRLEPHEPLLKKQLAPTDLCWYQLAMIELKLDLNAGFNDAIQEWSDEKRITAMEVALNKALIDKAISELDLEAFETALLPNAASIQFLSERSYSGPILDPTELVRGALPKLTAELEGDLPASAAVSSALSFALMAVATGAVDKYDALLSLLRSSFSASSDLADLANALEGKPTAKRETHEIVACLLEKLRNGENGLDPNDIYVVQCQLFGWIQQGQFVDLLTAAWFEWTRSCWLRISDEQRFLLRAPDVTLPAVMEALNSEGTPTQKAAKTLLAAENAVPANLPDSLRAAWLLLAG